MRAPRKDTSAVENLPEASVPWLKHLWLGLADEDRDHWRGFLMASRIPADPRAAFATRFAVRLPPDGALADFREWLASQEERDRKAAQLQEDEVRLSAKHPDWTLEQVRDAVLKHAFYHSLAQGDFQLGLKAVAQEVNVRRLSLDAAKLQEMQKLEQAKALEFCLAEARAFPKVRQLFQQAFAALKDADAGAPPP